MSQNIIKKTPLASLGYGFVTSEYLKPGEDEYTLRNLQNRSGISYKHLTAYEIEVLVRNRNTSDDWNNIYVSDAFNPELVKNCKFYGLVRIGKLEPYFLSFSDLKVSVGLYNSTIISCDFGDNVCIDNVNYLSHYIIGNEAIIVNVNELVTTNKAKFGNGIVKEGEPENLRIWLEVCNENGGRSILPFNGMLAGDAYLWSKYRTDEALLNKFKAFTEAEFKCNRGYYGKIGDRTVIKHCNIIKDVWIGQDAYIKGANKLKNLTINSGEEGKTQIGEGVELVNGIVGFGCRIFYGVKAVRFIMASHSQLKYGARLINSYLGNNATISCCEVLNSLIFPAHEQHHNNSFLCAALIMGQSNIAAGATIGSNHNSRSPDGEMMAGRGFWPGLCVSIKHNCKFASFTILAKGDYKSELNIPIPFALVNNDVPNNQLEIMPGYWFMYNMYALARNCWKYIDRDKRINKIQHIEYNYLAPDTINEMFEALSIMELATGKAYLRQSPTDAVLADAEIAAIGKQLLVNNNPVVNQLEITVTGVENAKRKAVLVKTLKSYAVFTKMMTFYGTSALVDWLLENPTKSISDVQQLLTTHHIRTEWVNVGGQLITVEDVALLKQQIKDGTLQSWDDVHQWYSHNGLGYADKKHAHAIASLQILKALTPQNLTEETLIDLLNEALATKEWITDNITATRAKDYTNPYRLMMYENEAEMNQVIGAFDDNGFIKQEQLACKAYRASILTLMQRIQTAQLAGIA